MSRTVVFGDVHGNLPAFEAVIRHAGECDGFWGVGDTVGYGPRPVESVRLMRRLGTVSVVGNHDLGSLGKVSLKDFNPYAAAACEWTGRNLDGDSRRCLESLPLTRRPEDDILLVHGSARDPVWEYVLSGEDALECFRETDEKICFHGHSHAPAVFVLREDEDLELTIPGDVTVIGIEVGCRYLVNVGSVGQPRDGDPRACYAEYDSSSGTVTYRRVEYPVVEVQEMMAEAGLPGYLAARLAVGR